MTFPLTESISAATALFSAGTAWLALRAARQANATATSVADIERQRWHRDQTPDITVRCTLPQGYVGRAKLTLTLNGPTPLDEVFVTIRNDRPRGPSIGQMTPDREEEFRRLIWGPWRFGEYIEAFNGQRSADFETLAVDEPKSYDLYETVPPSWMSREQWARDYDGMPLRITIDCRRNFYEPWILQREVPVTAE